MKVSLFHIARVNGKFFESPSVGFLSYQDVVFLWQKVTRFYNYASVTSHALAT